MTKEMIYFFYFFMIVGGGMCDILHIISGNSEVQTQNRLNMSVNIKTILDYLSNNSTEKKTHTHTQNIPSSLYH